MYYYNVYCNGVYIGAVSSKSANTKEVLEASKIAYKKGLLDYEPTSVSLILTPPKTLIERLSNE